MYKKSIKEISNYLIPFIEGIKYYGSNEVEQAIGTMIILNKNGDILTCRHIAEQFLKNIELGENYSQLINDIKSAKNREERKKIEKKYNLKKDSIVLTNINLPFEINTTQDIREDLRLQYRYLDLRNDKLKDNLILRSNVLQFLRCQMIEQGFLEVQTPILTSSSPEGARDFLVPSRLHPRKVLCPSSSATAI